MTEILSQISSNVTISYFLAQLLTVLAIFAVGMVIGSCFGGSMSTEYRFLVAFPVGLSVFSLSGILLLVFKIKYTVFSVVLFVALVTLTAMLLKLKKQGRGGMLIENKAKVAAYIALVFVLAILSVSGVVSVVFSNDSMYYYSAYSHEIVRGGYLVQSFDSFLTDTGLSTAVINTLPFLFGFGETFGIHTFFNLGFILFFFYSIFERANLYFSKRKSCIFAILATLILISSLPFIFVSKWILANMYFMEYMLIVLVMNYRFSENDDTLIIRSVLLTMLTFVRIEGALYVGLTMLTFLMLKGIKKKSVVIMLVPSIILEGAYLIKIFVFMNIVATYTFMTERKAFIAISFLVAVLIYGILISEDSRCKALLSRIRITSPVVLTFGALVLVNLFLFVYDRGLFIENVKVFVLNAISQSGWGFFVGVVAMFILLVPKVKIKDNYFDYFWLSYIFVSFAACFARGDGLRVDLFDSSNRVMLQIVPFIVYAITFRYIEAYENKER